MKSFVFIGIFVLIGPILLAQSFFSLSNDQQASKHQKNERSIVPDDYKVLDCDIDLLKKYLTTQVTRNDSGHFLELIDPEGNKQKFRIFETEMMQEEIARKYSEIKTYKGYNPDKKYEQIHLGVSHSGFYASVQQPSKSYSIDQYSKRQDRFYISYYHKDHHEENSYQYTCGTVAKTIKEELPSVKPRSGGALLPLREYRFALACTSDFGSFYGPAISDVMAEMMKSVNRMNQVLENDFAVRLVIINDNDKLINVNPDTDPYSDRNTGSSLLGENTGIISERIGFGSFDIGHVYTRACDDTGGIARLESACSAFKGAGVTCHYSNDITAMAIRVAAHEVGHQLAANHTFNNCNGNENSGTAYEPGSGTTIMSYGGLCGSELNVINVAEDYFHVSSLIEVTQFTRESLGNNCPVQVETSNHIPDIAPLEGGFSIPISTPFELEGVATDEDGDDLTYTWEQFNLGPRSTPGMPVSNSPLFISAYPSVSPRRVFPNMDIIVNNAVDKRETLPTYERDLNFQFVVRDNNPEAGGVAWTEIEFYATESAGPFLVRFPDTTQSFEVGQEIEVMWDVANTDNEIVNCQSVDILLSTDGGYTFDEILLSQTPNDGSEKIFIPNSVSENARIKIKASDNIFFDISNQDFTIVEPQEASFLFSYSQGYVRNCVPDDIEIIINTEGLLGYNEAIAFEVGNEISEGIDIDISPANLMPGEAATMIIRFSDLSVTGLQSIDLSAISAGDTIQRTIIIDLTSSVFENVTSVFPLNGSAGNTISPMLTWKPDSDADEYVVKLSDNPSFEEEKSNILYTKTVTDTVFILDDLLEKNTVYYWQVVARNQCGEEMNPETFAFATEAISCEIYDYNDLPKGISQSGVIEIDMPINIIAGGEVADVNVNRIRGAHTWVSELKGELISPLGTKVLLFRNKCGNQANFNAGFDDEAVTEITCPLSQGVFYQPQEKLDTFNGEEIAGEWIFRLTDTQVGNGGSVQEYKLEICSNEVLEGPVLILNEEMPVPAGQGRRISNEFLLTEDGNNSPEELIYTLLKLPMNGTLRNEEVDLEVGSQFTQKDIDNRSIRYQHNGTEEVDSFQFTVIDGEGGWVSTEIFSIRADADITISTEEINLPGFRLFPNPIQNKFNLQFDQYDGPVQLTITNTMGQSAGFSQIQNGGLLTLTLIQPTSGIYFVRIKGDGFDTVRKIVVE